MQDIAESRGIDPAMMGLIYEHIVNDEGIVALYNFQRKMNLPDGDQYLRSFFVRFSGKK